MDSTVVRVPLNPPRSKMAMRRIARGASRTWRIARCWGIAVGSVVRTLPVLLSRRPRTPLRLLCISAFEYAARLEGRQLEESARLAMACACDFGALRNDFYDQGNLDRNAYRRLRENLRRLVPEAATGRYIRSLRYAERQRPAFGSGKFAEPAAVTEYRVRVLVVSLDWLQLISRRAMEPHVFESFVALVGLVQLVDDLLDWKKDWSFRRPTYVTAFLRDKKRPSREYVSHIPIHANRFRAVLFRSFQRDAGMAPLTTAGALVWFLAIALIKIRFPR